MKVIQISSFFHPSVGGVERQVEEISAHLSKLNIKVNVFTTDAAHGKTKRMQRLDEMYKGIMIRRFRYILGFGYFFRFAPGLIIALIRSDYDLIHVHNTHDAHLLFALIIKKLRRKKLVLTGHNPYVVTAEKRGKWLYRGVGFFDFVLKFFPFRVDGYIALLESEKESVQRTLWINKKKIHVIPNGIQDIFYEGDGSESSFYQTWEINPKKWDIIVGCVGRLNYVKGIQNLEQAARRLPKVLFIFAGGDDGYYDTLRKMYISCNNVVFTGKYLSSEEVKDFYQAIDIFLLPSVYEPFGMVLVEAMAQGCMPIATTHGGPPEIIDETFGEVLPSSDQQLWFERISYYAKHKDETLSKGELAKLAAGRYQWSNVISQIIEVYKSLV